MRTTLYIKSDILKEVGRMADMHCISRSAMIIELLKIVMKDGSIHVRMGRLVQYQAREAPGSWHRFHITFRVDDYEFFQDLRKLSKKSLSLIIAEAVKKYLKKIVKGRVDRDNYPHANYVIIKEIINSIISWRLIWGFPRDIARILKQSHRPG